MNYGTNLGKEKSFINATASFQLRDNTSRAKDVTGNLYKAYNAVEQRAAEAGTNINALFSHIGTTASPDPVVNEAQILAAIKTYAPQVSYFTPAQQASIAGATSLYGATGMQTLLGVDVTADELAYRGLERRDFNMKVGQSSLASAQLFLNAAYPINDKLEAYAFGGMSYRNGEAAGFYRRPNDASARAYTALYPNGLLPEIHSAISDFSAAAGLRGTLFESWNFDLSNTFGVNTFNYNIENTVNASMRENSPTEFDAGGLGFAQNTTNFDMNRKFNKLNVAFGAEYRNENFIINSGVPDSYNLYDINGSVVINGVTPKTQQVTDFFGVLRPGAAQVFPGFKPGNTTDKTRNSGALYGDLEYDITSKWMVNGAVRYENYSDFGGTTNFKLATRYKVTNNINLRGAVATGFRAPSLHQIYFNSTSTQFVGGVPFEVSTFSNDSEAAQLLGIPKLKQEESQSGSIGFTAKVPSVNLTLTADAYIIEIKDRVVLTDQFAKPGGTPAAGSPADQLNKLFDQANATRATFFANAIDTQSRGIDIVLSQVANLGNGLKLKNDLAATFGETKRIGDIHASPILEANGQINRYYSETSRIYLQEAVPRQKINLTNTLSVKKFDFFLRNVYFGEVTDPNTVDANGDGRIEGAIINGQVVEVEHPVWSSRVITDLSVSYNLTKNAKIVVGANNLFDIYPTLNYGPVTAVRPTLVGGAIDYTAAPSTVDLSNANQFVYSRNVSQFGQNGRFLFARLSYSF
jgi:iron complex outermembrane receptor protein